MIVRVLGSGGQGVVYLCRHVTLDRLDAVKVMQPHLAGNASARERFQREAASAAKLHHPNIATVHDAGQAADGSFYVAMQYVEGPTLARLVASGPVDPPRVARIITSLAGALDAVHARGLLHRDVKPGNVLVAHSGTTAEQPSLVDFGIAKLVDASRDGAPTQVMGTYAYMAPERADGGSGDGRGDQYSLACTAYHCLVGSVPFPAAGNLAIMKSHLIDPPPSATARRPDLPPAVDAVLARAMAKSPKDRFPTCAAFAAALSDALAAWTPPLPGVGVAPTRVDTLVDTRAPVRGRYAVHPPPPKRPVRQPLRLSVHDVGRPPRTLLGMAVVGAVALAASVPLQRLLAGETDLTVDLGVQFATLTLVVMVASGLGTWLLTRRSPAAWFMLILGALAAPALRLVRDAASEATSLFAYSDRTNLDLALQWVSFQPLEPGYSAYAISRTAITLSDHGRFLIGLCIVLSAICVYGWWRWSTGDAAFISHMPRNEWPWLGGVATVVVVVAYAFGGLPDGVGVLVALALALNVVAIFSLAQKRLEGWLLFVAAQVVQILYALTLPDTAVRPPSMNARGLVDPLTPLTRSMAVYYAATAAMGVVGYLLWWVDLRRATRAAALR